MSEFIPLSVPNFGAREAELAGQAITSGWVSTSGGKVTEFEEALAAYVGMPRAVACNAGTSALHLAAMAAGITRGDEVIVPTLTFIAAVNPLTRYVGAEPIFIGCDDSLCIDPDAVEDFCANRCELRDGRLYNKATGAHIKALEVVHVFGNMADMPRLMAIAKRYGLIVIEDATEAFRISARARPSWPGRPSRRGGFPPAAARSRSSRKRWPLTWACPAPWPATPVPARCIWPLWPPASPAGMRSSSRR